MVMSQTLAALIHMTDLGDSINSRALSDSFGLSVMAHRATWVSRRRFKAADRGPGSLRI